MATANTTPAAELPQYAHHTGRITLTHTDTEPETRLGGRNGATTWWADGTTSYVLHFRSGHVHGWTMADETDTAIQALDSLRAGEHMGHERLWAALRDVRRLRGRLEALENELILCAREENAHLSLREVGEVTQTHHTTVAERVDRMRRGSHSSFRRWLVQGTARADMYGGMGPQDPTLPAVEGLGERIGAAPGALLFAEAVALPSGGYVITVTDPRTGVRDHSTVADSWQEFRPRDASARLAAHGYEVVPSALTDRDRKQFSGWKPEPGHQAFSVPVHRLPDAETQGTPAPSASPADVADEIAGKLGMTPRRSDR